MLMINPIDEMQRHEVERMTARYIAKAESLFGRRFDCIEVTFDLKGRVAGMYRVQNGRRRIRYNPYLFAKYYDDNLTVTVPHEVAHYITDVIHGPARPRPHGREWRALMLAFGVDASRTCRYDLAGIPLRKTLSHRYACACETPHMLGVRRHKRINRGECRYYCRRCGSLLQAAS
jgi:SprT protein